MEKKVNTNRVWKRLFGERRSVNLRNITPEDFELLTRNLEKLELKDLEWEADKASQVITVFNVKKEKLLAVNFFFLICLMNLTRAVSLEKKKTE